MHNVGYIRDEKRMSAKTQKADLAAHGITKVYSDWSLLMRQRRKGEGDTIAVKRLHLIADPSRRTVKGGMRQSLFDRLKELRKIGAFVLEVDTGRTTANESDRDDMIRDALDVLANTRARTGRTGRPPLVWTDDQKTIMRLHWQSRHIRTNREALAAMAVDGVVASVQQVTKLLGPSGRKPGTEGPKNRRKR